MNNTEIQICTQNSPPIHFCLHVKTKHAHKIQMSGYDSNLVEFVDNN
jgi:hypothetical protein